MRKFSRQIQALRRRDDVRARMHRDALARWKNCQSRLASWGELLRPSGTNLA